MVTLKGHRVVSLLTSFPFSENIIKTMLEEPKRNISFLKNRKEVSVESKGTLGRKWKFSWGNVLLSLEKSPSIFFIKNLLEENVSEQW